MVQSVMRALRPLNELSCRTPFSHSPSRILTVFLLGLSAVVAMAGSAQASRVQVGLTVQSQLLNKPIPYSVYMPDDPAPPGGWPVLYLLHGLNGNERDWLNAGNIGRTLDEMIAAKALPPLVAVMPMAGNSWYVNDPRSQGLGPVAKAMLEEFVPAIEKRHQVAACREARAIGGLSMGGYGALLYALDRPDLFTAAISLSGSISPEIGDTGNPNDARIPLPFRSVFGEPFDRNSYQTWNLYPKVRRLSGNANKPALFLTAADEDFPRLLEGAVTFQHAAASAGFKTELRVDDGAHTWPYWAKAVKPALSWLSGKIATRCN